MNDFKFFEGLEIRTWLCEKHGNFEGYSPNGCPECILQAERKEQAEAKKKQWEKSNVEPYFWNKTFCDFEQKTDAQKKAFTAVMNLIETKNGCVVLLGNNGVGKTMLASLSVMTLGGAIYTAFELSAKVRACYNENKSEMEVLERVTGLPLLALDEFGRSKMSESEVNWISYIIDKRLIRGLPIIICSNLSLDNFCGAVGNDILSRLQGADIVNLHGEKDYRGKL